MKCSKPHWERMYYAIRQHGGSMPYGDALKAANGGKMPNPNTAQTWRRDMDWHLRHDADESGRLINKTSTTVLCYALNPPNQTLPAKIKPATVPGQVFRALSSAAGRAVPYSELMESGWPGACNRGSSDNLQVQINPLKAAGVGIERTRNIMLRPDDSCDADRKPRNLFDTSV